MRRLLRFRDLEYVVALAEAGSFVRAAERIGVSQPTLSTQVRRIEALFGVVLFDRHGNKAVVPTPEGERVLDHARSVLRAFRDLNLATDGHEAAERRHLRFGLIPTVAPYLGPPLLRQALARDAACRIDLDEAVTERLEAQVQAGELDFAVTTTAPRSSCLAAWPVGRERMVYVSRFPLGPDPLREVDGRPILLMQEGHCFRDLVHAALERLCRAAAANLNYHIGPASLMTLTGLVRAGVGDTILPAPFVGEFADLARGLHRAPLPFEPFGRGLRVVVRRNRQTSPDLRAMRDLVAEVHAGLKAEDYPPSEAASNPPPSGSDRPPVAAPV